VAALFLCAAVLPAAADERSDEEARVAAIYTDGMLLGAGGTYGFYVKAIGRPAELAREAGHVFDPVGAILPLHLLQAVAAARAGKEDFADFITFYRYPTSRNAGTNPSNSTLCPNPADEKPENAEALPLRDALGRMMGDNNYRVTRGVELRLGRAALNARASSIGMTSTRLDQIVGCGYDDGRKNATTLADLATLYESVQTARSVDAVGAVQFLNTMSYSAYKPGDAFVEKVVRDEAKKLGIEPVVPDFAAAMNIRFKGGTYNVCVVQSCFVAEVVRVQAGVLSVPFRSGPSIVATPFVFGSYIEGLQVACLGSSCPGADRAATAVQTAIPEMFRTVVRRALQTWK
jgi:hypothetical protein